MAAVAATSVNRDLSQAAIADTAPIGERAGIQHGTFKGSGLFEAGPEAKDLSDISGDGIEIALGPAAEPGPLRRRRIHQQRAYGVGIQPINFAAISGSHQR